MKGKVALVTGGSSGIGRATALAFAREGARVAIASRNKNKATEAVQSIKKLGGEVIWIQTDISNAAQVRQMVHQTVARFGRIDYAFNNGGSGGNGRRTADMDERDWDKTIDGYLKSVWLCMKYEILAMLKRGRGGHREQLLSRWSTGLSVSSRVSVFSSETWRHRIDQVRRVGVCLSRSSHQCCVPGLGSDTACRALDEA